MNNWSVEQKVAATLTLLLLFTGYLLGVANVYMKVGFAPDQIEKRYAPPSDSGGSDLQSFFDDTPPPISMEKLVFIAHAHLIPYTLIFALLSFFVVFFSWPQLPKIIFLSLFALVIIGDIASIFAIHLIHPAFAYAVMVSGGLFGVCVAGSGGWALYEMWLRKKVKEAP